jgi:hypothetical protein
MEESIVADDEVMLVAETAVMVGGESGPAATQAVAAEVAQAECRTKVLATAVTSTRSSWPMSPPWTT